MFLLYQGDTTTLDFLLNDYMTRAEVINGLEVIRGLYQGGRTNLTGAFRFMREEV